MLQESHVQVEGPKWRRSYPFSAPIVTGSLVICDMLSIAASGLLMYRWFGWSPPDSDYHLLAITFVAIQTFMLSQFGRLYVLDALIRPYAHIDRIVLSLGTAFLLLLATLVSLHVLEDFSLRWIAYFAGSSTVTIIGYRIAVQKLLKRLSDRDFVKRNVAVVGSGRQAQVLVARLRENPPDFASFVGVFDSEASSARLSGDLNDLTQRVRRNLIDDIIIAMPWSEDEKVAELVEGLSEYPVSVYLAADLVGFRLGLAWARGFNHNALSLFANTPVLEVSRKPLSGWNIVLKAIEDYVLGAALLVVLAPVFALVAAAIKLDSPGPVFYRQKRLGFNNQVFDIYKFRSMRVDSDDTKCTVQAARGDPRVTRVGRFIRQTSLDELPQLLNVLNGTMSLVGPRPHALDHNEDYSQQIRGYFARHRVKPGITGWAQVNGLRGGTPKLDMMEARVRYDIFYTENWSILFDLRILLQTAVSVVVAKNAY